MPLASGLNTHASGFVRLRQKDHVRKHCKVAAEGAFRVRAIFADRQLQQRNGEAKMSDGSWAELFPYVFFPFKIIVLGIGMFYAIKWHHDQAKKDKETTGH